MGVLECSSSSRTWLFFLILSDTLSSRWCLAHPPEVRRPGSLPAREAADADADADADPADADADADPAAAGGMPSISSQGTVCAVVDDRSDTGGRSARAFSQPTPAPDSPPPTTATTMSS